VYQSPYCCTGLLSCSKNCHFNQVTFSPFNLFLFSRIQWDFGPLLLSVSKDSLYEFCNQLIYQIVCLYKCRYRLACEAYTIFFETLEFEEISSYKALKNVGVGRVGHFDVERLTYLFTSNLNTQHTNDAELDDFYSLVYKRRYI